MAGGIDWFRWHHGSVTDPKFKLVARKAGVRLPDVLAVWAFVLEKASASEERGSFGEIDCEAVDCLFGLDDGQTAQILEHMGARGLVNDGQVSAWEKRQPKRERDGDNSTDRTRAYRERQKQQGDAKQNHVTPCDATERQETPREEKSREEKSNSEANASGAVAPAKSAESMTKDELWSAGKSLLAQAGIPKAQCGSLIGKLVKDYGDVVVVEAVRSAVVTRPADPVSYIKAACMHSAGQRANASPKSFAEQDREAGMRRWEQMTGRVHPDREQAPPQPLTMEFVEVVR